MAFTLLRSERAVLILRENKQLAAILGGLAAVILLVILFKAVGGSDSDAPANAEADPTVATSATAQAVEYTGPNIEKIDCGTLLPSDAVRDALGGVEAWSQVSQGENCIIEASGVADTFVQIQPGSPNDFAPGATLFEVTGTPVGGVGDTALWFAPPVGDGSTGRGALVVAADSDLGALVFRVAVGRPDLDSDAILEIAKTLALAALPRFPGVQVAAPTPEPTAAPEVVRIEHEPVDRSDQSYVDNLLAREAAGDWTRGQGLVETLRLFAGEASAADVLLHPDVFDQSGTGIVQLADEYLEDPDDDEVAAEIERLLAAMFPEDDPPFEDATVATAPARAGRVMALLVQTPDCYVAFPTVDETCFKESPVAASRFGDKYTLVYPDIKEGESWEGWVKGESTVQDGIVQAADTLEALNGEMPKVQVWLTPDTPNAVRFDGKTCRLFLGKHAQALGARGKPFLQQAVASALARCYIFQNIEYGNHAQTKWWEDGLAWYLSDVAFPGASMETEVLMMPAVLATEEPSTGLQQRALGNMAFFEYLDAAIGVQGAVDAAKAMHEAGPSGLTNVGQYNHDFARALTDGAVLDQTGAHPYVPHAPSFELTEAISIAALPRPFGADRLHLTVEAGKFACMEYPNLNNLDLIVSWRAGPPGTGGSWSTQLPSSFQGEAVFLVTTTEPDSQFDLNVIDVDDDQDCKDDEEPDNSGAPPIPGTPCGFCPPTSFFWDWLIP